MFDKYLIGADSLRNTGPADAPTGFAFQARLGYYRGLGLSMVEDLAVTVDGESVAREAVRLHDGERAFALDDLEGELDGRWEFGAFATIEVERAGGLLPGEHRLTLGEKLRISYLPFPLVASDEKVLTLKG